MVPVVIKGRISDSLSGVDRASGSYITLDSYGLIQPSGAFAIAADGSYSVGLLLEARRNGQDKNGRTYTITLAAKDNAGNIAHIPVVVTVPHNQ